MANIRLIVKAGVRSQAIVTVDARVTLLMRNRCKEALYSTTCRSTSTAPLPETQEFNQAGLGGTSVGNQIGLGHASGDQVTRLDRTASRAGAPPPTGGCDA